MKVDRGVTTPHRKKTSVKKLHNNKPRRNPMINLDKRNGTWPGKPGDLRFGTWNIRTLYKPGALHNIIQITSNYRTEITALQEIRWPGNGILKSGNSTILYSGKKIKNMKMELASS